MDLIPQASQQDGHRPPIFRDRGWFWFRNILIGLVLCRGLAVLCIMPPFEAWDEYQHVGFIAYLAETGEPPRLGEANVPVSLLSRLSGFPHSRSALKQLGNWGTVDYATFWSRAHPTEPLKSTGVTGPEVRLYQAQHGPFYYRLVSPLFRALGGVNDLRLTVGGLRLVNLLLTVASVWIALGIVHRYVQDARLAVLCGLMIATQPLFLMNGTRVANDALGVVLATAAVGLAMRFLERNQVIVGFAVGLVAGLAVLAKAVNLGLLPFIGVCWLAVVFRSRDNEQGRVWVTKAIGSALIILAGFVLVTYAQFRDNYDRFGSPTVMQEAVLNRAAGHGTTDLIKAAGSVAWRGWLTKLWLRDSVMSGGWSWSGKHEHLRSRFQMLAGLGMLGWGWMIFPPVRARVFRLFRNPYCPALWVVLFLGYTGALSYHAMQSQLCWGSVATNPWYAAAAYPFFLILLAGGAFAWPVRSFRYLLPAGIALLYFEIEACSVLGSMTAMYASFAPWNEALRRLALLQPAMFCTTTLYAAMAGVLAFAGLAGLAIMQPIFRKARTSAQPRHWHIVDRAKLKRVERQC